MCTSRSNRARRLLALTLILATAPLAVHAQNPNTPARGADPAGLTMRTYEVGDLIVHVPDYPAPSGQPASGATVVPASAGYGGGGFGGGGGGAFGGAMGGGGGGQTMGATQSDPFQITFDSLIDAMVNVVAPQTWEENGSGPGVVKPVGAALAVWQTPEVHAQISAFLDMLRQGSASRRALAIDARWLMLDSEELGQLVATAGGEKPKVDRKLLDSLTRRPTSMRGIIHCFSGQLVYLISGTRRNVVSSYIPVVGSLDQPEDDILFAADRRIGGQPAYFTQLGGGEDSLTGALTGGKVGYQPVIEKPNFGVLLEIRPTAMQNENAAVVDLKSTVTFPGQPAADAADRSAFDPAMATPRVDRLAVEMQELATTLRLPLGEPVLVGGMTYLTPSFKQHDRPADVGGDDASESRQLYIVLEIR